MKMNSGTIDRRLRIILGLFVVSLAFWGLNTNWAFIGLVPLITGVVGLCPLYSLLNISTCNFGKKENS